MANPQKKADLRLHIAVAGLARVDLVGVDDNERGPDLALATGLLYRYIYIKPAES